VPGHRAVRVEVEASLTVEVHAVRDARTDLCKDIHIIYLYPGAKARISDAGLRSLDTTRLTY
jgi:hypothetical protein